MTSINSYLTFNGNCREAMIFYKDCLGGELTFQTIGESALSEKMPKKIKDCILHSTLTKGSLILMGSDMVDEQGFVKGNNVSLSLNCSSEEEIKTYYTRLSNGGLQNHSLENSFWGALFGDLTDRYGNHWILSFYKKNDKSIK
jgi:PhnB protein